MIWETLLASDSKIATYHINFKKINMLYKSTVRTKQCSQRRHTSTISWFLRILSFLFLLGLITFVQFDSSASFLHNRHSNAASTLAAAIVRHVCNTTGNTFVEKYELFKLSSLPESEATSHPFREYYHSCMHSLFDYSSLYRHSTFLPFNVTIQKYCDNRSRSLDDDDTRAIHEHWNTLTFVWSAKRNRTTTSTSDVRSDEERRILATALKALILENQFPRAQTSCNIEDNDRFLIYEGFREFPKGNIWCNNKSNRGNVSPECNLAPLTDLVRALFLAVSTQRQLVLAENHPVCTQASRSDIQDMDLWSSELLASINFLCSFGELFKPISACTRDDLIPFLELEGWIDDPIVRVNQSESQGSINTNRISIYRSLQYCSLDSFIFDSLHARILEYVPSAVRRNALSFGVLGRYQIFQVLTQYLFVPSSTFTILVNTLEDKFLAHRFPPKSFYADLSLHLRFPENIVRSFLQNDTEPIVDSLAYQCVEILKPQLAVRKIKIIILYLEGIPDEAVASIISKLQIFFPDLKLLDVFTVCGSACLATEVPLVKSFLILLSLFKSSYFIGRLASPVTLLISQLLPFDQGYSDSLLRITDLDQDDWHHDCYHWSTHFYRDHTNDVSPKLQYDDLEQITHATSDYYAKSAQFLITIGLDSIEAIPVRRMLNNLSCNNLEKFSEHDFTLTNILNQLFQDPLSTVEHMTARKQFVDRLINSAKESIHTRTIFNISNIIRADFRETQFDQQFRSITHPYLGMLIRLINEARQAINIQLRILLVTRSPKDALHLDAKQNHGFEARHLPAEWRYGFTVRSVHDQMVAVISEFGQLHPSLYYVLNVDEMGNFSETAHTFMEFLGYPSCASSATKYLEEIAQSRSFPKLDLAALSESETELRDDLLLNIPNIPKASGATILKGVQHIPTAASLMTSNFLFPTEAITNLQYGGAKSECNSKRFLVLDLFVKPSVCHCEPSSARNTSRQPTELSYPPTFEALRAISRSLSFTLGTGRTLIVPQFPTNSYSSDKEFEFSKMLSTMLSNISLCSLQDIKVHFECDCKLGKWELVDDSTGVPISGITSEERIIVGSNSAFQFDQYKFSLSFGAFNLSVQDYIRALDNFVFSVITTSSEFKSSKEEELLYIQEHNLDPSQSTLCFVLPPSDQYTASTYAEIINRQSNIFGISQIYLTFSCSLLFPHQQHDPWGIQPTDCSKLQAKLMDIIKLLADGNNRYISSSKLTSSPTRNISTNVVSAYADLRDALTQSFSCSHTISTYASEGGLFHNSLYPRHVTHDLFGYSWIDGFRGASDSVNTYLAKPELAQKRNSTAEIQSNALTFIKKRSFSDTLRFVFIAGVEGSGHHYMESILGHTFVYTPWSVDGHFPVEKISSNQGVTDKLPSDPELEGDGGTIDGEELSASSSPGSLTSPHMLQNLDLSSLVYELFRHNSLETYLPRKRELVMLIKNLQNMYGNGNRSHLPGVPYRPKRAPVVFLLNTLGNAYGMQSYPNMGGNDKHMHHPSLATLAQIMEEIGVDFRIISLIRSPQACHWSTIRRDHGTEVGETKAFTFQARGLHDNLRFLDSDIRSIDPAFTKTVELRELQKNPIRYAETIAQHIGLTSHALKTSMLTVAHTFRIQPDWEWKRSVDFAESVVLRDFFDSSTLYKDRYDNVQDVNWKSDSIFPLCYLPHELKRISRKHFFSFANPQSDATIQPGFGKSPLLLSIEGSGDSLVRFIVEQLTGHITGSVHGDFAPTPKMTFVPLGVRASTSEWTAQESVALTSKRLCSFDCTETERLEWKSLDVGKEHKVIVLYRQHLDIAINLASMILSETQVIKDVVGTLNPIWNRWWKNIATKHAQAFLSEFLEPVSKSFSEFSTLFPYMNASTTTENIKSDTAEVRKLHFLRYEDIFYDPRKTLTELAQFLDLPIDQTHLDCTMNILQNLAEGFQPTVCGPRSINGSFVELPCGSISDALEEHAVDHVALGHARGLRHLTGLIEQSTNRYPFKWLDLLLPNQVEQLLTSFEASNANSTASEQPNSIISSVHNLGYYQPLLDILRYIRNGPTSLDKHAPQIPADRFKTHLDLDNDFYAFL